MISHFISKISPKIISLNAYYSNHYCLFFFFFCSHRNFALVFTIIDAPWSTFCSMNYYLIKYTRVVLLINKKLTNTAFQDRHVSTLERTIDMLLLLPSITVDFIYCLLNNTVFLNRSVLITSSF